MKLRDVLDHDRLLLVACHDCHAKTPLDPARYALRVGVHADISDLLHDMTCPVCGASDITLGSHSPLDRKDARRPVATVLTPDSR